MVSMPSIAALAMKSLLAGAAGEGELGAREFVRVRKALTGVTLDLTGEANDILS